MWFTIGIVLGALVLTAGIVVLCAAIAHKKRGLSTDADFVKKLLPGIDCGMCGDANCDNFARKVADGKKEPECCKIIRTENAELIKKHFKPSYKKSSKLVAMVKCKGGCKAVDKYSYEGAKNCAIEEALHSGSKACKFACLGCGDCVKACKYRAISLNDRGVAEINRSECVGCGECVGVCPNKLITMRRLELTVGVVCNNQSSDPAIKNKCDVGCSHCGKCINICPVGAITVVDNMPVIDPDKCIECYKCVGACPNHVISRL